MSIQISGTNVIGNDYRIKNIEGFDSTVQSVWNSINYTITAGSTRTLANREYFIVGASGVTVNLPASDSGPQAGWEVLIAVGNYTNTVINGNGNYIMGDSTLTVDVPNVTLHLVYSAGLSYGIDSSNGWRVV